MREQCVMMAENWISLTESNGTANMFEQQRINMQQRGIMGVMPL
jgi:hypothetical protein